MFNTWEKLLDSDFVVWAQATKIEVVGDNQYRTTFTILHTYKGTPPQELSFDWAGNDGLYRADPSHLFRPYDIGGHFILFSKKIGDRYSMQPERFMAKRYSFGKEHQEIDTFYIKDLPPDLEGKVITEKFQGSDTQRRYLMWDDVKEWLDNNFKN